MAQAVRGPYTQGWEAGRRITDQMIEAGARALYAEHLKTTTFFRDFEEMRESFEAEARTVIHAALAPLASREGDADA